MFLNKLIFNQTHDGILCILGMWVLYSSNKKNLKTLKAKQSIGVQKVLQNDGVGSFADILLDRISCWPLKSKLAHLPVFAIDNNYICPRTIDDLGCSKSMVPSCDNCTTPPPARGYLAISWDIFGCHNWGCVYAQMPWMLLSCIGQLPKTIICPKMPIMLCWKPWFRAGVGNIWPADFLVWPC